ncbi:MAG TPA: helix-turn-helix domain-containing protein [Polyangiaceae bacterium]
MDLGKLGARIKQQREKRRLRQADVAAALRLSAQAVSKWERGENAPDIALLVRLSQLLGVSVEWILSGNDAEPGTFQATVMITTIVGYADRATQVKPSELAAWANVFHFAVTEAVLRHDGVPIKCVGDGSLGFFAGDGASRRAALSAREALRAVEGSELVVVLHAGPIFLGLLGHPDYARTDIIGTTVNSAFMLVPHVVERCASRIGLSRCVADELASDTPTRSTGTVRVLGCGVELFELPP